MAPEQLLWEPIDHRVDQWAVGGILGELLAGRRRFDAATVPSLIYQVVHHPLPPAPAGVSAELLAVMVKALAKRPADRFPNLEATRAALAAARENLPTTCSLSRLRPAPLLGPRPGSIGGDVSGMPHPALATPRGGRGAFLPVGSFGEARPVRKVALSPDDTFLAAGGLDGAVYLWDLANRMKLSTLRNREHPSTGHRSPTSAMPFSDGGAWLAAGYLDGSVYLWDRAAGLELDFRLHHDGAGAGVAFVPGGQTMITAGADAKVLFSSCRHCCAAMRAACYGGNPMPPPVWRSARRVGW